VTRLIGLTLVLALTGCPEPLDPDEPTTPAPPCDGEAGLFRDQAIEVDGEVRRYLLYVPEGYDCAAPIPLLLDFHGTGGSETPEAPAEEFYGLDPQLELADEEGFAVLRPRSLTWLSGDTHVFQWDAGPGHLEQHVALTHALLEELTGRYNLGPLYVFGFSNGTNMAAQLLGEPELEVAGVATVGGGVWAVPDYLDLSGLRAWNLTGYRDYMLPYRRALDADLLSQGVDPAALHIREADAGHELHGWHYRELWDWLVWEEGPAQAAIPDPWIEERPRGAGPGLLEVVVLEDGAAVAAGEGGTILRRDAAGAWTGAGAGGGALVGLCATGDRALAVGEADLVRIDASGVEQLEPIDDFGGYWGGDAWMNGVACTGDVAFAAGYWNAATSDDLGGSWAGADAPGAWGGLGQFAAADTSDEGTWIGAGYFQLSRSEDGANFDFVGLDWTVGWWNDVHAGPGGRWWLVGDGGRIDRSDDDGLTWFDVSPDLDLDLYALSFADASTGLAVGDRGAAVLTRDGGASWEDVSLPADLLLAGVAWLPSGEALVVGEGGLVLRLAP